MRISLEFSTLADMLVDLPKFAALISGSGTMEERMVSAGLDFDVAQRKNQIAVKITPPPGVSFTEEDKAAMKAGVTKAIAASKTGTQIAENVKADAEKTREATQTPAEPPKKEKAKKNTPAPEKAADGAQDAPEKAPKDAPAPTKAPDVTEIRKVMKACLDAGKRDEAKAILTSVGADNVTTIPEDKRAEVLARMTALAAGKE